MKLQARGLRLEWSGGGRAIFEQVEGRVGLVFSILSGMLVWMTLMISLLNLRLSLLQPQSLFQPAGGARSSPPFPTLHPPLPTSSP